MTLTARSRIAGRLAWALFAASLAITLAGLGLEAVNRSGAHSATFLYPNALALAVCFPLVGLIIAHRQPGNAIGWIFFAIGLSEAVSLLAAPYGVFALEVRSGALPGGLLSTWVAYIAWVPGFTLLLFLLLLFPTGRWLTPGWRWVGLLAGLAVFLNTADAAWNSWPLRGTALLQLITAGTQVTFPSGPAERVLSAAASVSLVAGFVLAVAAMALRLRHSRGIERQQLKWFSYAIVLAALLELLVVAGFSSGLRARYQLISGGIIALQALALVGIAAAVGVAIARYRLFDIDVVIHRTLVYGLLTTVLALVYFASAVLFQTVLRALAGASQVATVGSTLLTAALFNPLRRRIQVAIDRRFYRRQYDAAQTLAAYGTRLRTDTDLESVAADLLDVVDSTLGPEHISIWLGAGAQTVEK